MENINIMKILDYIYYKEYDILNETNDISLHLTTTEELDEFAKLVGEDNKFIKFYKDTLKLNFPMAGLSLSTVLQEVYPDENIVEKMKEIINIFKEMYIGE